MPDLEPSAPPARRAGAALLVLGYPQSAVDALAKIFKLLGADLLGDSDASSPVCALNDALLAASGSHRGDWLPLADSRVRAAGRTAAVRRAARRLAERLADARMPVLADSASARFAPFWCELLRAQGFAPLPAIAVGRPGGPLDTCADPCRAHAGPDLVWLRYLSDAEADTRGMGRLAVVDETLGESWRRVVARLEALAGVAMPCRSLARETALEMLLRDLSREGQALSFRPMTRAEADAYAAFRELAGSADELGQSGVREAAFADSQAELDRAAELVGHALGAERAARQAERRMHEEALRALRECLERRTQQLRTLAHEAAGACPDTARFDLGRLFDADYYLACNRDIAEGGLDPLTHFLDHGWREWRNPLRLFDTAYYRAQAPDLNDGGCDPLSHYLLEGAARGLDPHPLFATSWYLERHADSMSPRVNPLVHYLERGAADGLDPHPLLDSAWYLAQVPDAERARRNPLVHFLEEGAALGLSPHPLFDTGWYLQRNPEVARFGLNPLLHFVSTGAAQGCAPHPLFDTAWYVERWPQAAAPGVNPLVHYLNEGAREGCDPNPMFDSDWYLCRHPEVAASGVNPLVHYVSAGAAQGLDPGPGLDTEWYLAQLPGADRATTDALSHYLHRGRLMGLFARLETCAVDLPSAAGVAQAGGAAGIRIGVFAHLFHAELAWELLAYVSHIPFPFELYVSTDTPEKRARIRAVFERAETRAVVCDCRALPNIGRDWGPLLAELAPEALRCDAFCHVHSKRSAHFPFGEAWRRYLLASLLGSEAVVRSILSLLAAQPRIGLVFPETYPAVREHHQWGSNRAGTAALLERLGLDPSIIDLRPLEFPAGSMFWCRSAALRPLLEAGFRWEELPREPVGADGTLLHAVERSLAYIAVSQGYLVERIRVPYAHGPSPGSRGGPL